MAEFTESDIRNLTDEEVDISGGCGHLRDIAAESGMDCDTCFTSRTLSTINGIPEVEVYYDENGSVFSAWKAWKKGIGGSSGSSREEAIVSFLVSYADECKQWPHEPSVPEFGSCGPFKADDFKPTEKHWADVCGPILDRLNNT
jgi:hypothetical protein